MKIYVSESIKKLVMKKRLVAIIKFLILTLITTLLFVFLSNRFLISWARVITYVVYVALIICFAFITKLIKIIFDRSYQGTISALDIAESLVLDKEYYPNLTATAKPWFQNSIFKRYTYYATVVMDNGKAKKKKLYSISMKTEPTRMIFW